MQPKILVLFDFDGTLTTGDTLSRFLLFAVPKPRLVSGVFLWIFKSLWLLCAGQWSNEKSKEALLSIFFKGESSEVLHLRGTAFCQQKLPHLLRTVLLVSLREYRNIGATIVIVSASADIWLRPFCTAEGIDLICTELQMDDSKFTGRLATPNCNGQEKARRIKSAIDLASFQKIIAFGNSSGDAEMLAIADEAWIIRSGGIHLISTEQVL